MKRFTYIPFLSALLSIVLLSSCFHNDFIECGPNVRIYFTCEASQGKASEIDRIDVFVYDIKGTFIGQYTDENVQLTPEYFISVPLEAGEYTFVAWVNLRDCYKYDHCIENMSKLPESELYLHKDPNNVANTVPHPLFFSDEKEAIVTGRIYQNFVLPLVRNTNTINLTTTGLPPFNEEFIFTISDCNGNYNFDNSFASETEEIHYITNCVKDEKAQLSGTLNVMRLAAERKFPVLRLTAGRMREIPFEANLIDLILKMQEKNPSFTFENTFEYNIVLKFDTNMDITVIINGWELNEDIADI